MHLPLPLMLTRAWKQPSRTLSTPLKPLAEWGASGTETGSLSQPDGDGTTTTAIQDRSMLVIRRWDRSKRGFVGI